MLMHSHRGFDRSNWQEGVPVSLTDDNTRRRGPGGPLVVIGVTLLVLLALGVRYGLREARRAGWWGGGSPGLMSTGFRPTEAVEDAAAGWLASFLVEPAQAGEAITPRIRYEHAWPQWFFLLVAGGGIALVVWLYRREGNAPGWYKGLLGTFRIGLIFLAMFMLSEAVLSVDRTGLPTFVVMVDDSASGSIVDQYEDPKLQAEANELAKVAGREKADRMAVGLGWLLRDEAKLARDLSRQQKLKFYRVSDAAVPVAEVEKPEELIPALKELQELEPTGEQSRLGEGVRAVLDETRGVPPTAILLLTDGRTTDGAPIAEAAEIARKEGVPLFTIGLGDVRPARDLELTDLQVDEVVFVNDVVRFEARLQARGFVDPKAAGQGGGPTVNVHLKRRKPGSNNDKDLETVGTVRVPIPPDGRPQKVEIPHAPNEVGQIRYVVEVEEQPREIDPNNNRIERTVDVRDEKLKVLLVEGRPRWEFRYLKNYLERDETIQLDVVLQSADDLYAQQDRSALPSFPAGKDGEGGLYSYDAVIIGDVDPSYLNAQQMTDLVEFVEVKGGGLMLVAGELFNPLSFKGKPLEPLLPILLQGARNPTATGTVVDDFKPALTPEGLGHPIFRLGPDEKTSLEIWESLPRSYWYFEAPRKQPAAVVLAEHPTAVGPEGRLPILVYQYAGSGKVLFSAIDDTWRWRLRVGDRFFGRYWVQAIRFLARSKLVGNRQAEITTDRLRYRRGQPVEVQVRFPNPALAQDMRSLTVEVSRGGQSTRKVLLRPVPGSRARNLFEGTMPPLAEGRYTVRLLPPPALPGDLPSAEFQIDPPAGEFVRVEMDREDLADAAHVSGGQFFRWDEKTRLIEPSVENAEGSGEGTVADSGETLVAREKTLPELLPAPQKVPLDTDPPIALWNTWPVFGAFLGLIGLEWVLRKRKQMV
jgi:hypothetical protein